MFLVEDGTLAALVAQDDEENEEFALLNDWVERRKMFSVVKRKTLGKSNRGLDYTKEVPLTRSHSVRSSIMTTNPTGRDRNWRCVLYSISQTHENRRCGGACYRPDEPPTPPLRFIRSSVAPDGGLRVVGGSGGSDGAIHRDHSMENMSISADGIQLEVNDPRTSSNPLFEAEVRSLSFWRRRAEPAGPYTGIN
jgi:hypothetical protein